MATLVISVAAFLKGYMYKEAFDNTSYEEWKRNTGPATFYNAIADAEHHNRPSTRFIRSGYTKAGTTAYGPVQANKQYLEDFLPTGRYASVLADSPRLKDYVAGLVSQADKFLLHGNMKGKLKGYDPKYDYYDRGGTGLGHMGSTDVQKALYKTALTKMMKHRVDKEFGGDWDKYLVTHRWGRPDKAKPDPHYYKAYGDSLKKQYNDYIERQKARRAQMAAPERSLLTSK